jgi:hypothetical protein
MANEIKAGSGITTESGMRTLREQMTKQFGEELNAMSGGRVGFKPKQIADMKAGFEDGARNMLEHLRAMGVVVVLSADDEKAMRDAAAVEAAAG